MFAKAGRNFISDPEQKVAPKTVRENSVVDRLVAGATPPVSHFSEQHLERLLKTNSAMQVRAHELREARVGKQPAA